MSMNNKHNDLNEFERYIHSLRHYEGNDKKAINKMCEYVNIALKAYHKRVELNLLIERQN